MLYFQASLASLASFNDQVATCDKLDKLVWKMHNHVVRKPAFCICENKDADQLRGNREADQRLCFRYTDSKIPLLS